MLYGTQLDVQPENEHVKTTSISFVFSILEKLFLFAVCMIRVFYSPFAIPVGCMQDGTVLGDVQLPPWADGDPHKFILLHRQVSKIKICEKMLNWVPLQMKVMAFAEFEWALNFACLLVCLMIHPESRPTFQTR